VTLWVVQPPGEVVAFDPADFSRVGGVRIPREAFDDPGRLSINGVGQMLVPLAAGHLWLWDGEAAKTLALPPEVAGSAPGDVPAALPQWLLGNDRRSLYVLQREVRSAKRSAGDSVPTSLVVREMSLALEPREVIEEAPDAPCETHGYFDTSPEPCPEPTLWAIGGVARDFFVLTRWEEEPRRGSEDDVPQAEGRLTLFRRGPKGWRAAEPPPWSGESLLDVSADGHSWIQPQGEDVYSVLENETSDVTWFVRGDSSRTVFDEWSQFHNRDYDVSFFTANAVIAPGGTRVAYTVHATAAAATEIPLSPDGHPDTLELAAIRHSLAELPLVEVVDARSHPVILQRLAHCELVGWASDSEVLVVEKRRVVAVDVTTGHRRESGIRVRDARDVSVVRR